MKNKSVLLMAAALYHTPVMAQDWKISDMLFEAYTDTFGFDYNDGSNIYVTAEKGNLSLNGALDFTNAAGNSSLHDAGPRITNLYARYNMSDKTSVAAGNFEFPPLPAFNNVYAGLGGGWANAVDESYFLLFPSYATGATFRHNGTEIMIAKDNIKPFDGKIANGQHAQIFVSQELTGGSDKGNLRLIFNRKNGQNFEGVLADGLVTLSENTSLTASAMAGSLSGHTLVMGNVNFNVAECLGQNNLTCGVAADFTSKTKNFGLSGNRGVEAGMTYQLTSRFSVHANAGIERANGRTNPIYAMQVAYKF